MLALAVAPLLAAAPEARAELLIGNLNIGTATTATQDLAGGGAVIGQGFTTGTNAGGYTLETIQLFFRDGITSGDIGDLAVTLRSESSGNPGTTLHTLTNPASIAGESNGNNITAADAATFTAPSGTALAANTTYFVVLEYDQETRVWGTPSGDEESGGAAGWSIADDGVDTNSGGNWETGSRSYYIRVNGAERAANSPATGAPTISGTAQVGETLTAATTAISDTDGLTSVSYSYQWIRVDGGDTDISGATSSTYTPVAADVGKKVKVKVSFTDDAGYDEELTSAAWPASGTIMAMPGPPPGIWSGTLNVRNHVSDHYGCDAVGTLDRCSTTAILSDDDFTYDGVDYTISNISNDHSANSLEFGFSVSTSLTPAFVDNLTLHVGGTLSLPFWGAAVEEIGDGIRRFTWRDAARLNGTDTPFQPDASLMLSITESLPGANRPATGLPVVSGAARAGETVTALTHAIRDGNGLTGVSYAYQWIRVDGSDGADIAGATGRTYALTADDQGKRVRVRVAFTDDADHSEELTSAAFPSSGTIVMPAPPPPLGGIWSAMLSVKSASGLVGCFSFNASTSCSNTDTLTDDDFTVDPTDYTVIHITIASGTLQLQFGRALPDGASRWNLEVTRSGATTTLNFGDDTDSAGDIVQWASTGLSWAAGDSVGLKFVDADITPPTPDLTMSGVPRSGDRVNLVFDEDLDHDNRPPASAFSVMADGRPVPFAAVEGEGSAISLTGLSGAILHGQAVTVSYTDPTAADDAAAIQDAAGNDASTFTAGVPNRSLVRTPAGAPGAPTGLTATADGWTRIDLSWTAPTDIGSSAIAGYRVEWSADGLSGWQALIADTGRTRTTYTDAGLSPGTTRHYRVSAVNAAGAGAPSGVAGATTGVVATGAPAITGVAQVGRTLTASTRGISDGDGLTGATFAYQWIRVDSDGMSNATDLSGATTGTYVPVAADAGKRVLVKVSFTDDAGNAEELTSAAHPATGTIQAASVCAAPSLTGDLRQVWTGTLTVGSFTASGTTFYGYTTTTDPDTGALSPAAITVGTSYTAATVAVGGSDRTLSFVVDRQLEMAHQDGLVLHVCGDDFPLRTFSPRGMGIYSLVNSGLDWSSDSARTLYLSIDDTVPLLESAVVDGSTLVLTYHEDLDEDAPVPTSAYQVSVAGGAGAAPSGVAVDGRTVTLTLAPASAPVAGQTVTLTYAKPASPVRSRVQDPSSNEAAALTAQAVDNRTAGQTVTIAAAQPTAIHQLSDVAWTLTRTGTAAELAAPLMVNVTTSQTAAFLSRSHVERVRTATFAANADTVTLTIPVGPAFEGSATTDGTLTATVAAGTGYMAGTPGAAPVLMLVGHPAVTVAIDEAAYEVREDVASGTVDVYLKAQTAFGFPAPTWTMTVALVTEGRDDGATSPDDYAALSESVDIAASDWVAVGGRFEARVRQVVTIVNDGLAEEDEVLNLLLDRTSGLPTGPVVLVMSDGSACPFPEGETVRECSSTLTILADGDTPVLLETATVDGQSLVLTYNKDLDEDSTPDKSAFEVSTGQISSVAVSGKTVTLTLTNSVLTSDVVTVNYTVPEMNPVQDADGINLAAALDEQPVRNVALDDVAPELDGNPVVTGTSLVLTYNEAMDTGSRPAVGQFDVRVTPSGGTAARRDVSAVEISGKTVTLTLDSAVVHSEVVTLGYTVPATNPLQDVIGNDAAALSARAVDNESNALATGAPTIRGTAAVGRTLGAVTQGIVDVDGLTMVSYAYQWIRVDSDGMSNAEDIAGATSAVYAPVAADVGKKVRVKVNFTDDGGNEEELTSTAWPAMGTIVAMPVQPPGGGIWSAVLNVGETNSGEYGCADAPSSPLCSDPANLTDRTFSYAGIDYTITVLAGAPETSAVRINMEESASSTDAFVSDLTLDIGEDLSLPFSDARKQGTSNLELIWIDPRLAAAVSPFRIGASLALRIRSSTRIPRPAEGTPRITGRPRVGETLTAVITGISDDDGLDNVRYEYQWMRVDSDGMSNPENIAGATAATYVPVAADAGKKVRVRVTFVDDGGNDEELTGAAWPLRGTLLAMEAPLLGGGIWSAVLNVGETNSGEYGCADAPSSPFCSDPANLTDRTFSYAGIDYTITVLAGAPETSAVRINMEESASSTDAFVSDLTLDIGEDLSLPFSDARKQGTSNLELIWTDPRLAPTTTPFRIGASLALRIRSSAFNNVPATGAPAIAGTAVAGETLTAATTGIADDDGLDNVRYEYQWVRVDSDGMSNPENIAGATAATHVALAADVGKKVRVRVTFRDDLGNDEELTSAAWPATGTIERPAAAEPESATVDRTRLVLTFNAALDETSVPGTGTFDVQVTPSGGTAARRGVTGVEIDAGTVILTLASAVLSTDTVTVEYLGPDQLSDPALRDLYGSNVAAFASPRSVDNDSDNSISLSALSLTGIDLSESFEPGRAAYTASVPHPATRTTVTATAGTSGATVTILPADASSSATLPGHQVNLDVGATVITITVAHEGEEREYTVTVTRSAAKRLPPVAEHQVQVASFQMRAGTGDAGGVIYGYGPEVSGDTLTPNQFDWNGVTYRVVELLVNEDQAAIFIRFDPHPTREEVGALDLQIRTDTFLDGAPISYLDLGLDSGGSSPDVFAYGADWAAGPYTNPFGREERAGTSVHVRLVTEEMVAPVLERQTVSAAKLVLTYDEALDETSRPAPDAYEVQVTPPGGTAERHDVTAVGIGGETVTLTLARPVRPGQTVTLGYTVPASNPVQDLYGNAAPAIDPALMVSNETGGNRSPQFDGVSWNMPPSFHITREVPENSGGGVAVGEPVRATDPDGDTLAWSITRFQRTTTAPDPDPNSGSHVISTEWLEWGASAYFTIDSGTGQIRTKSGVDYDYEKRRSYFVEVQVVDALGALARTDVLIQLTDQGEPEDSPLLAPEGLTLRKLGPSAVALSWQSPASSAVVAKHQFRLGRHPISVDGVLGGIGPQNPANRVFRDDGWMDFPADAAGPFGHVLRGAVGGRPLIHVWELKAQVRSVTAGGEASPPSNVAFMPDTAPTMVRVGVVSDPGPDGVYAADDTIAVALELDEPVRVRGRPLLNLQIDGATYEARYAGLSHQFREAEVGWGANEGTILRFEHVVPADGEVDANDIAIASQVTLDGATVTDATRVGNGLPAVLSWASASVPAGSPQHSEGDPLTASFASLPGHHDGETSFTFRVAFSEAVAELEPAQVRDHGFEVTGGRVTGARRVDGESALWELTVAPTSDGEVTVALAFGRACTETGAFCAADGRMLTNGLLGLVAGPATSATRVTGARLVTGPGANGTWDEGETVTAEVTFSAAVTVQGAPTLGVTLDGMRREAAHTSGEGTAVLRFSYPVAAADAGAGRARLVANGFDVSNGAIGDAHGRQAVLDFAVAPYVTAVAILPDPSGDGRWTAGETIEAELTFSEAVTVTGGTPTVGVTAGGAAKMAAYDSGAGTASLAFAYPVTAADGTVTRAALTADSLALNDAALKASASGLAAETGHGGAERTASTPRLAVLPALSVTDAQAVEGAGAVLAFTVTLAPAATGTVTVDWATADGTAVAGSDYTAGTGTLTFAPGETSKTVSVAVVDDSTIETGSGETVTLGLSNASGAVLADASATGTIADDDTAPVTPGTALTAQFTDVPSAHAGPFSFRVSFSEALATGSGRLVPGSFAATGAAVTGVRKLGVESSLWEVSVRPRPGEDAQVTLAGGRSCETAGAVCAAGGGTLSNSVSATVPSAPMLSISDARAVEGVDASMTFTVTLAPAASGPVTVDYATGGGSATAGQDYTGVYGRLRFAAGETSKTIEVAVLDDDYDEDEEIFHIVLYQADGAYIADGAGRGTIANSDAMPRAWLSRFGRTVAEQAVDAVEGRFAASRQAGVAVNVAGRAIGAGGAAADDEAAQREAEEAGALERMAALSDWLRGDEDDGEDGKRSAGARAVTPRDLLTGTSFALTAETSGGGFGSVWGRGAVSRFDGREGSLSLEGDVTSAMLGADLMRDAGTVGVMLMHSRGAGSYRGTGEGKVSSTVTGLYPYGRYRLGPRLDVWGVAGYGGGRLTLTPKGDRALRADIDLMMAAAGLRGVALEAPAEGGLELAVTSDALAVRTSSEKVAGLAAAEGDATRLRVGLQGSWRGDALTPRLEVGIRQDGGDAETGFGADIGAGLAWSDAARGIAVDVSARGLLTHEASGFRDQGIAGTLSWDPTPGSDRGASLTLGQSFGGSSQGGMDALLGRETLAGLAANDNGAGDGGDELRRRRLDLRLGYGLSALGDRFTSTPELGLGLSNDSREYSLGWRLNLTRGGPTSLELGLEATRREYTGGARDAEHAIAVRLTARF